jgi:hypothetical protein
MEGNRFAGYYEYTVTGSEKWKDEDVWVIQGKGFWYRDGKLYERRADLLKLATDCTLRYRELSAISYDSALPSRSIETIAWNGEGYEVNDSMTMGLPLPMHKEILKYNQPLLIFDEDVPWTIELLIKSGNLKKNKSCNVMKTNYLIGNTDNHYTFSMQKATRPIKIKEISASDDPFLSPEEDINVLFFINQENKVTGVQLLNYTNEVFISKNLTPPAIQKAELNAHNAIK